MKNWLACCVFYLVMSGETRAAAIEHVHLGNDVEFIGVQGTIVAGDESKFSQLAVQYKNAIVAFDSPGGQLFPALEIGKEIHLRGYATLVGKSCASACALMWVAGSTRLLTTAGKVGFHASYLESNGKRVESGVANALVGRYLTQLDLPESSIVFATSAGPETVRWLTAKDHGTSSITFDIFDPKSAPPEAPTRQTAVVASTAPTHLGGWRLVAESDDGAIRFVNTDGVVRSGRQVQFWEDSWWGKPSANGANRSVELIRADCVDKSFTSLKTNYFVDDAYQSSSGQEGLDYAVPGSMIDGAISAICLDKYYSAPIQDRPAFVAQERLKR